MMERRRLYEPMDLVAAINGQVGIVLSETGYAKAKEALKNREEPGLISRQDAAQTPITSPRSPSSSKTGPMM